MVVLDTSKLKVGSVVRLTGEVTSIDEDRKEFAVAFNGRDVPREQLLNYQKWLGVLEMQHAELISTPVEFTDEQIEAIKGNLFLSTDEHRTPAGLLEWRSWFEAWLEAHREKK